MPIKSIMVLGGHIRFNQKRSQLNILIVVFIYYTTILGHPYYNKVEMILLGPIISALQLFFYCNTYMSFLLFWF